jgi:hypothetical protein
MELTKEEARAVKALVKYAVEYGKPRVIGRGGIRQTVGERRLEMKLISLAAAKLGDEWNA